MVRASLIKGLRPGRQMMISRIQCRAMAGVFAASVLVASSGAQAAPYDGVWSVVATAQRGDCTQYSYELRVSEGRITYEGAGAYAVGRVSAQGRMSGSLQALGQTVSASGRLTGNRGGGTWNGAGCSGRWQAQKQA